MGGRAALFYQYMGSYHVELAGPIEISAGPDSSARAVEYDVDIVEVGSKGLRKRPRELADGTAYCARPAAGSGY